MRTIKEIMQNTDSACRKEDNLKVIACRMFLSDFMFLPVVNDDKKVIGVVTYNDVMNAVGKADGLKISMEVADIMKIVPCIYTYEDEATTLNVMRRNKSAHLPVVDTENHLEGVISFMVLARRIIQFKRRMGRSEKSDIGNLEMSF